jgi:hypothetical protein
METKDIAARFGLCLEKTGAGYQEFSLGDNIRVFAYPALPHDRIRFGLRAEWLGIVSARAESEEGVTEQVFREVLRGLYDNLSKMTTAVKSAQSTLLKSDFDEFEVLRQLSKDYADLRAREKEALALCYAKQKEIAEKALHAAGDTMESWGWRITYNDPYDDYAIQDFEAEKDGESVWVDCCVAEDSFVAFFVDSDLRANGRDFASAWAEYLRMLAERREEREKEARELSARLERAQNREPKT